MHSWRPRSCLKWIALTLLMAIIARFKANQCVNRAYQPIYVGPPLPPEEILSRHVVGGSGAVAAAKCLFLCEDDTKCVGFNVRASLNDENCQLTNVTKSTKENSSKTGEWKLFRDLKASACKGVICHNGGGCASNHKEGTWQCRCSVNYTGKYCEKYNPYGGMIRFPGIVNNELFEVKGEFNHATAKNVCNAFGARQPSWQDIDRIAREAEYGFCKTAAWNDVGGLGYPEYNGNCHTGSNYTGYFTYACCSNKETTLTNTWCLKKNIDFCKPGWHGSREYCYLFRDDDLGTFEEAKRKCAAENAVLAKVRFTLPSFRSFIKRLCPDCRSMYIGAEKNGNKWSWLDAYIHTDMNDILWGAAEPQAENNCAEYNTELHVLTTLPCNTPRGYMCRYQWLG